MTPARQSVRVLFVCMGNICRSPAADIVFHHVVAEAGLTDQVEIDSAGTIGYHAGSPPDHRMAATLKTRGYVIHGKARQVVREDLDRFDLVVAMDRDNEAELHQLATPANRRKIHRFTGFCSRHAIADVPDPYYGGTQGFEQAVDLIEDGCAGILEHVRRLIK